MGPSQSSLTEAPWYLRMGMVSLYCFVVLSMGWSANERENPILKLERNSLSQSLVESGIKMSWGDMAAAQEG